MATVTQRIKNVTTAILNLKGVEIKPELSFTADLGADSTQSIELVAAFEEEFDITMDEDKALGCDTIEKAITYITEVCTKQGKKI
jgi:acyl carrier protein